MARGLLRSRLFAFSRFLLLFLLACQWTTPERTRKAGKGSIERIKRLIDEKARRQFAQSDAVSLPEPAARNPAARRNHDELAVNGQDGEYLQGDLELAEWQAVLLQRHLGQERGSGLWRRKRKVGRSPCPFLEPFYKRWDRRRPISFDFADSVPEQTRHTIRQALTLWERETCLRFAEGGPDVDRLEFFDGGGCSSFVGRAGGTQGISIATPGCDFVGIIAHEVGHALGTFHEQARPDQQRHIAVHYNNIPLSRWNNFQPVADDQAATLGLPYDAGSVMHYGPYGFASDQFRPTISTLDRQWQSTIGQRTGPSFLDIQAINQAYGCSDHCAGHAPACLHGGYPHPNDCSRCQCPNGFAGKVCQAVQPSPCGAALQLSTRQLVIATPNHPAPFPPDLDCFWLLKAPPGGHVHLQFFGDQFFYGCDDTCDKTFVELKTGPDFRVTGYRFCCSIAPVDSFRSAGPEMVVIHSAKGLGSAGFKARVWSNLDWPIEPSSVERPNLVDVDTVEGETVGKKVVETAVTEGWWWWEQASSRKPVVTTTKMAATTSSSSGTTEVRTENASVDMEGSSSSSTTTTQATTTTIIEVEAKSTTAKMETAASTDNAGGDGNGKTSPTIPTTASMPPNLPEEEQGREEGSNSNASTSFTPNPEVSVHAISPAPIVVGLTPFPHVNCSCQDWSSWTDCSQMCGGCGRRRRLRQCQPGQPLCQLEERRMCNQQSCPQNTNFLFNNGEFHLLWKGCCIGLFLRKDESNSTAISHTSLANQSSALLTGTCGPLDTNDNAFLRILSTLLSSQDGKKRPAANLGNSTQQLLLSRRRTGEH